MYEENDVRMMLRMVTLIMIGTDYDDDADVLMMMTLIMMLIIMMIGVGVLIITTRCKQVSIYPFFSPFRNLVLGFRVTELSSLLRFAGKPRHGTKNQLQVNGS